MRIAFAGTFAASPEASVRARLTVPCEVVDGESGTASRLSDVEVLVTLAFTREMGAAARRLRLVQVAGAGLDRIDRSALPSGAWLTNAYGHEVGIAEYAMGAILALNGGFTRLDAGLRRGVGVPVVTRGAAIGARAFDMAVWAMRLDVTRSPAEDLPFLSGPDALDEILRQADFLVIALSLNAATRKLPRRAGAVAGEAHRRPRQRGARRDLIA